MHSGHPGILPGRKGKQARGRKALEKEDDLALKCQLRWEKPAEPASAGLTQDGGKA